MVTRGKCVLEYTGEQLDEADGDLIMALIAFAQPFLFGTPVVLNRKQLLRAIKSGKIGISQYVWLHQSMKRLRDAANVLYLQLPGDDQAVGEILLEVLRRPYDEQPGRERFAARGQDERGERRVRLRADDRRRA